ncbi:hypothetical protein GOBAR_AA11523 [Gossypium barbadense]|uniref:Uncharacterized protein n=1 Tax=Gossypium barbadense TaxID=3634 RepID=A0A2P5Y0K6_GOSBA|nr:hypothetical protein GOBAR_AA11523 [Gossypium barbadense]
MQGTTDSNVVPEGDVEVQPSVVEGDLEQGSGKKRAWEATSSKIIAKMEIALTGQPGN